MVGLLSGTFTCPILGRAGITGIAATAGISNDGSRMPEPLYSMSGISTSGLVSGKLGLLTGSTSGRMVGALGFFLFTGTLAKGLVGSAGTFVRSGFLLMSPTPSLGMSMPEPLYSISGISGFSSGSFGLFTGSMVGRTLGAIGLTGIFGFMFTGFSGCLGSS